MLYFSKCSEQIKVIPLACAQQHTFYFLPQIASSSTLVRSAMQIRDTAVVIMGNYVERAA